MKTLNNDIFANNSKDQENCKFQELWDHYCEYNMPLVVVLPHLGAAKLKTQLNRASSEPKSFYFTGS